VGDGCYWHCDLLHYMLLASSSRSQLFWKATSAFLKGMFWMMTCRWRPLPRVWLCSCLQHLFSSLRKWDPELCQRKPNVALGALFWSQFLARSAKNQKTWQTPAKTQSFRQTSEIQHNHVKKLQRKRTNESLTKIIHKTANIKSKVYRAPITQQTTLQPIT